MRQHPGRWVRPCYRLGRRVGGGVWSCCGAGEQLRPGCTEAERSVYEERLRALDAAAAARAARLALGAERRRSWEAAAPAHRATRTSSSSSSEAHEVRDVPSLVRFLRQTSEPWSLAETLGAALAVANTLEGRQALVREGVLRSLDEKRLVGDVATTRFVRLLAALAACDACRPAFVEPKNAHLAFFAASLLRTTSEDPGDILTVLSAASASPEVATALGTTAVVGAVATAARSALERLVAAAESASAIIRSAARVARFGFETLGHLADAGADCRERLRAAGCVRLCVDALGGVRAKQFDADAAEALAAAVSTHCKLAILDDGDLDDATVAGIPALYNALRSQLARADVQLQGLRLVSAISEAPAGAAKLDSLKGAWQWLGRTPPPNSGGPRAEDLSPSSTRTTTRGGAWTATRLASFLEMRGLHRRDCDHLDAVVADLRSASLLPSDSETRANWRCRVRAFEKRNSLSILDRINNHSSS